LPASAHPVVINEGAREDQVIVDAFYAWSPCKVRFAPEQITLATEWLCIGGLEVVVA
jgi:hypothetical protein